MIYDTFMFWNELDMLECRLTELYDVVDKFIVVECGETHQGAKKLNVYLEHAERFRPWADKIEYIWVGSLTARDPSDREHEQREYARAGLELAGAGPDDIIIHSDVDEIPTVAAVHRFDVLLRDDTQALALDQRLFCFAVDWEHPMRWSIPTVARYKHIESFNNMRNRRYLMGPLVVLPEGGHHLSWLGGPPRAVAKLDAFLHTELAFMRDDLSSGRHAREGYHVDGTKLAPVTVDETWPKYIREKRCPKNWFRSYFEKEKDGEP